MPGTRTNTACGDGLTGWDDAPRTAREAVAAVEEVLTEHLAVRLREAREVDRVYARDVAGRVAAFTRRRGKRLRAAFVWCGWRAAGGTGDPRTALRVGAALELVQACALIHDDVMDESPMRRGAPSVQADFARMHATDRMRGTPEHFSTAAAVLAGDLALAWADDLLAETAFGTPHAAPLLAEWRAMRGEMVAGQYRDVHAQATGASGMDEAVTIAALKSALYTVERPLALGAVLAGADVAVLDALHSAGRCAGLAFQLRDDLLGAFGEPAVTGKPAGEDLRGRRLTYLFAVASSLAEASGDEEAVEALRPEGPTVTDEAVARMRAAMERTGARAVVEAKIGELAATSVHHFAATGADRALREEFAASVEIAAGTAPGRTGEDA
ncbi:polyprenyl synthetase family protein [Streptomyces roseolilacinus]|uniref:polyprenyl synthetase family protein n=1 Tax=Streptomyces roseolilacinus TaxID=66904 RepID=UPI0038078DC7